MAKHSKRHNIKHRKAAQDAKKSQVYARIGKMIQMAAKDGADASMNPRLETALTKAKQAGLPKEVIQRAIEKGSGAGAGDALQEVFYEGYGPGGVALYIKCITDNSMRSTANVKATLSRMGASLGEPGSVAWQFKEKGELFVTGKRQVVVEKGKDVEKFLPFDSTDFEVQVLETAAEDYEFIDETARVVTSKEDFVDTVAAFESAGRVVEGAELQYLPENELEISEAEEEKLERIIEMLEDDEDVDQVWHNAG